MLLNQQGAKNFVKNLRLFLRSKSFILSIKKGDTRNSRRIPAPALNILLTKTDNTLMLRRQASSSIGSFDEERALI
jgi:hypothetical protein